MKYTTEQKMRGEDLHGLPCRVPKPTAEQARCTHMEQVWVETSSPDPYTGELHYSGQYEERSTCVDIPGTNNFRCTRCGYTRRY